MGLSADVTRRPSADDASVIEIRIHGRGGQGVVTAAELLSVAAFDEGRHAQAFPTFGSERTGAPVMVADRGYYDRIVEGARQRLAPPSFARVPARTPVPLPVADAVHTRGFFVGNSHAFGAAHGARLAAALRSWRTS